MAGRSKPGQGQQDKELEIETLLVAIRLPGNVVDDIDRIAQYRRMQAGHGAARYLTPGRVHPATRTDWIREALAEKLEREADILEEAKALPAPKKNQRRGRPAK